MSCGGKGGGCSCGSGGEPKPPANTPQPTPGDGGLDGNGPELLSLMRRVPARPRPGRCLPAAD